MRKKLQQTGNSRALIINKEMLRHLGVAEVVEVRYIEGGILLTNPDTPASEFARAFSTKHGRAMKRLAE
ncbi:MAG: AbrB/MazE/SpoVT family DNA-binding domain-containing protein [Fimbriimonadaceae bacterium]|nr:AbrB/MazE/SpoVT family DNA-binding domain-containing protein [Chthonomonadaceae bacterium]MCO5297222.1 AbrB/MazE/SpoVT family DNA-binding domain-containing protein [Fimbriimonadaceae bacterium]